MTSRLLVTLSPLHAREARRAGPVLTGWPGSFTYSKKGGIKTDMDKTFHPEKYGMLSCIECNGNGKLVNEFEDIEVCPRCGGFGFVKKKEDPDKNGIASPLLIINVEEKSNV